MAAPRPADTGTTVVKPSDQDLARVVAERDAALAKLEAIERTRVVGRGGAIRRITVGVLVVLVALLVPVTAASAWVRHTVLNTGNYVDTVAPIASNPAVTAAVARTATDQLFTALDPQQIVADALPPRAAFLAAPITNGVKGFVESQVSNVLNTAAFHQIWITANRVAHEALLKVLNGQAKAVQTSNGEVVLSLVPLLNEVLVAVQKQASALIGKDVTLPTLTGTELPSAACAKISDALNRPLPATCGQIPLFPADKLDQAQRAVRLFKNLVVVLLVVTPLLALLALWLSRRRRRTLMQMAVGVMLGMVLLRRTVFWLQDTLVDTGKPENTAARSAIVHQVLHGFFALSIWVLWIALAVLAVAAVTGPYRWAVTTRQWVVRGAENVGHWTRVAFGQAKAGGAGGWIPAHLEVLRIGGAGLALVLILALNLNFVGVLIVLVLTAAYEFWLYRIRAEVGSPPGRGARATV